MERAKKVNINKLEEIFKSIDSEEISVLGISLVSELKFMKKTLADLKKEIKEKGVVVSMPQGEYSIDRSNPAITSYNSMIKNYNSTIKQINELLNVSPSDDDTFDNDDLTG